MGERRTQRLNKLPRPQGGDMGKVTGGGGADQSIESIASRHSSHAFDLQRTPLLLKFILKYIFIVLGTGRVELGTCSVLNKCDY